MPPAGGRFGPQLLSGPFSHLQNSHIQHHSSQHQTLGSAGLPPPSFNAHPGFTHSTQNTALNPFAPTNGTNGLAAGFGAGGSLGGGGTGLASHAAVMGFAHGAAIQQQQQAREALRRSSGTNKAQNKSRIRDVWQGNLAQEMQTIRELVDRYPYISMVHSIPRHFQDTKISHEPNKSLGHRVPWGSGTTNGKVYNKARLPLPDSAVQCRPAPSYPAWYHSFLQGRRDASRTW